MDFSTFQDIISKIDGVIHVKIVSENDEIKEIHILSNNLRSPKQIVRDIESSLIASFDYRVDRKTISIAQIQTDEYEPIKRIKFNGIYLNTSGSVAECSVKLLHDDEEYFMTQKGIKTASNRRKIVAEATIKAVEQILGQDTLFDIQDVLENKSRDITFINVLVNIIVNDHEETMIGSAIVKNDINEAIAKATLDAVNRRVEKNSF